MWNHGPLNQGMNSSSNCRTTSSVYGLVMSTVKLWPRSLFMGAQSQVACGQWWVIGVAWAGRSISGTSVTWYLAATASNAEISARLYDCAAASPGNFGLLSRKALASVRCRWTMFSLYQAAWRITFSTYAGV